MAEIVPFNPNSAAISAAEETRNNRFQDWLNSRKQAIQQEQTDAVKMARFNALGNVLTTMVQPLGWGVGGSTGGVQPYDERQYLDSFNRAVKASSDLRNIGTLEDEYKFKLAEQDYQRALNEYDYQKRRNESNEDYFARLDRQQQIKSGETYQVLIEKRRENAVKAYYTEQARRVSHKLPLISFTEFLDLDGLGKEYYGNWTPTESEVQSIAADASGAAVTQPAATATPAVAASPATKTITSTGSTAKGTATKPAATGTTATKTVTPSGELTADEKALVAKWAKYDANGDGQLSSEEIKVYNKNRPAGAEKLSRWRSAVGPINSALKKNLESKKGKGSTAKGTASGPSIASVIKK